jgi:cholesterol transport system auxiliary component
MSARDSIAKLVQCALLGAVVAGCNLLPKQSAPEPSLFTLQPIFSSETESPASDAAPMIAIAPPEAQAGFDGPRMAYVTRPFEIQYFARHQWVEPPARLLKPLLEKALERAGRMRPVASGEAVAAALRLETEIVALQQEFDTRPSRLRFGLRAQLLDPAAGRVIATTELEVLEPAESDDPYGGVLAANRAVARLLEELAAWCDAQARRSPGNSSGESGLRAAEP